MCQKERGPSRNWLSAPTASSSLCSALVGDRAHFARICGNRKQDITMSCTAIGAAHICCAPPLPPPPPTAHLLLLLLRRPDAASLFLPVWLRPCRPSLPKHPSSCLFDQYPWSQRQQFSSVCLPSVVSSCLKFELVGVVDFGQPRQQWGRQSS